MALFVPLAFGLDISDHYSPLNRERAIRTRTDYLLLHTTEGPTKGSLNKLHRYGECHYLVGSDGHVYRIVNKRRIAFHAGRSMWRGQTNLDSCSVAIEVAGYHNRDISAVQYKALKSLIESLQQLYKISDERVLTHSMVAYGSPNRWHKRSHRGRKRCGMLFAKRDVRKRLGLEKQPLFDPDVKAGRLVNADPHLARVLYGSAHEQVQATAAFQGIGTRVISPGRSAWDIARDQYKSEATVYIFPDGKRKRGNEVTNWKAMPSGTRVVLSEAQRENEPEGLLAVGKEGSRVADIAGDEICSKTTIYFMPDGRVRQGHELSESAVRRFPEGTRMLVGYVHGGYVTAKRSAYDICGEKWSSAATFYRFRDGSIVSGDQLKQGAIPPMCMVFFEQ